MHRVNAVGNTLGVRRELTEGIGSLPEWRKGVRQKKTETHRKIIGGSRKACRERFAEGIEKLSGNTLGDRRKKIERIIARILKAARLAGAAKSPWLVGKLPVPGFIRVWSSPKEDRSWMPGCLKKEDSEVDVGRWR
ncbi:hypothetical protein GW17_00032166 [Ensete ventricosum]|nr:hypothetical protein GW17_00032166 [Ensete ventricosum]RZS10007.1 hypothetical protein BHM03_00041148 [Ensete ventricosum]